MAPSDRPGAELETELSPSAPFWWMLCSASDLACVSPQNASSAALTSRRCSRGCWLSKADQKGRPCSILVFFRQPASRSSHANTQCYPWLGMPR